MSSPHLPSLPAFLPLTQSFSSVTITCNCRLLIFSVRKDILVSVEGKSSAKTTKKKKKNGTGPLEWHFDNAIECALCSDCFRVGEGRQKPRRREGEGSCSPHPQKVKGCTGMDTKPSIDIPSADTKYWSGSGHPHTCTLSVCQGPSHLLFLLILTTNYEAYVVILTLLT